MNDATNRPERAIEIITPATAVTRSAPIISAAAAEVDAVSRIDIGSLLKRYIWLLVILVVLGAAGGFVSVVVATPVYRSRLLLEIQQAPVMSSRTAAREAESTALQTQMLMIRNGAFLRRVVNRMQTETLPMAAVRKDFFGKLRAKLRPEMRNSTQILSDGLESAVNNLEVREVNGTTLLEITSESTHPEVGANFVNTVGSEFIDQALQTRSFEAQRANQFLGAQVEETRLKLREAEEKLQDFMRNSGNLFAGQETTLADQSLRHFQGDLTSARSERMAKQAKYEKFMKTSPEQILNLLEDGAVRGQQAKLNELRQQRTLLLSRFTANHYKVQQLDLQIREVEEAMMNEAKGVLERMKTDYEAAQRREALLSQAHAGAGAQVGSQAGQAAQYAALKREVDILRQAYSQVLMQASEAGISNALPQNNMRVVDLAVPAPEPLRPKPPLNIAFGSLLGVGLAGGIVFLRERFDASVKRPGSARELLNLRELGVIPNLDVAGPTPSGFRLRIRLKPSNWVPSKLLKERASNRELLGWQQKNYFAESFRQVMASFLRNYTTPGKSPTVVLVTSPNPSEGKTTVTSNLAICLAETGRRILIIDADFRRPRIHTLFGVSNEFGLSDLLQMKMREDEQKDPKHGIQDAPGFPGLSLLASGPEVKNHSQLLYSNALAKLLADYRQEFDFILIDAPPLLQIADSRAMDCVSDGVILVLRAGATDRKSALDAYRCLHEDGAHIFGTVLNDWRPSRKQTQQYYSYVRSDQGHSYANNGAGTERETSFPVLTRRS